MSKAQGLMKFTFEKLLIISGAFLMEKISSIKVEGHSCPLYPKNFLSVSLSFVIGIFVCNVVLSVQLFLQDCAKTVGTVDRLKFEIQMQPTLPETPALVSW